MGTQQPPAIVPVTAGVVGAGVGVVYTTVTGAAVETPAEQVTAMVASLTLLTVVWE